jgi:hypothetical protein
MSASTPPPPATSGNGKYVLIALVLLAAIVGLVVWRNSNKPPEPQTLVPPPPPPSTVNPKVDDVPPPPPPEPDAGPPKRVITTVSGGCDNKGCGGSSTPELENALAFRAKQAHRCYDQALTVDNTLKGKVQIAVRVAANGNVCSASVASNDMGTPSVAQCVAGYFRATGHFPAPKGGCVDANVPISFVPGGK